MRFATRRRRSTLARSVSVSASAVAGSRPSPFRVVLLATGGTIEKSYDAHTGGLALGAPVIEQLIETLVQPDVSIQVERLMARDSLEIESEQRGRIVTAIAGRLQRGDAHALLITHGTDTLAQTAAALVSALDPSPLPVVLTGAMIPYRAAGSDALQNVAQALMACRLLGPGVYAVFHGRVIAGDRVVKDYARLTLVEDAPDNR